MLVIIAILINLPNEYKENLFTKINKIDIDELTKTLPHIQIEEKTVSPQSITNTDNTPAEQPNKESKPDCVPEFIISKDMLNKAQNNLIEENIPLFPNEMKEKHVNIQGYFADIKGFNV
tara:strand:- start:196 stop:552 length:357 start_codon:yes stop_codon:yes gene_type:complete